MTVMVNGHRIMSAGGDCLVLVPCSPCPSPVMTEYRRISTNIEVFSLSLNFATSTFIVEQYFLALTSAHLLPFLLP